MICLQLDKPNCNSNNRISHPLKSYCSCFANPILFKLYLLLLVLLPGGLVLFHTMKLLVGSNTHSLQPIWDWHCYLAIYLSTLINCHHITHLDYLKSFLLCSDLISLTSFLKDLSKTCWPCFSFLASRGFSREVPSLHIFYDSQIFPGIPNVVPYFDIFEYDIYDIIELIRLRLWEISVCPMTLQFVKHLSMEHRPCPTPRPPPS